MTVVEGCLVLLERFYSKKNNFRSKKNNFLSPRCSARQDAVGHGALGRKSSGAHPARDQASRLLVPRGAGRWGVGALP